VPAPAKPEIPASESPAPAAGIDDLFGEPAAAEPEMKKEKGDDLFGDPNPTPAEAAVEQSNPSANSIEEDLFGTPEPEASEPNTAEAAKSESENSEPANSDSQKEQADDPFKDSSYRNWKDNTGNYKVRAKLVVIYGDSVRLLKDSGRYTTVPFSRLSDNDRRYVAEVLAQLSSDTNTQLVEFSGR
jgi:hypothetical protein